MLGAAEDVGGGLGAEALIEPGAIIRSGAGGNGLQVAGQHELEQRAEVVERVFQRRTGEQETAAGAQRAQSPGVLRAAVLDVLGLVGDDAAELHPREEFAVAGERAVTRDDQIAAGERRLVGGAPAAVVHDRPQLGREPGTLAAPVLEERGGGNHQGGIDGGGRRRAGTEEGEGLQGFAEPHLVGEDATEIMAMEVPEPGGAKLLVGSEGGGEVGAKGRGREGGQIAQRLAPGAPGVRGLEAGRQPFEQRRELRGPGSRHAAGEATRGCGNTAGEDPLRLAQLPQPLRIEEIDAVACLHIPASAGDRGANGGFVGGSRAQADGHLESGAGRGGFAGEFG